MNGISVCTTMDAIYLFMYIYFSNRTTVICPCLNLLLDKWSLHDG